MRTVSGIAEVTTSSIGALGGAAVGSVVGGFRGAVSGVAHGTRQGIERGSHSTSAAVLTMAAAGAVGLVEWPVILTVGGAALVLRQLHERGAQPDRAPAMKAGANATTDGGPGKDTADAATRKRTPGASTGKQPPAKKGTAGKNTTSDPQGRTAR
ncbi:hypothetical protein [Rhodococcus sp. ACT016]|uniref:hypothetical protein n=1 Tax=Rhodococcus sp. ACT016 TaxID=3134808 RepID=UPI003D2BF886